MPYTLLRRQAPLLPASAEPFAIESGGHPVHELELPRCGGHGLLESDP